MLVTIQSDDRLHAVALPAEVGGAHWIEDASGFRLAFVEARDSCWQIDPCATVRVRGLDGSAHPTIDLDPCRYHVLNLEGEDGRTWCVLLSPDSESTLRSRVYGFSGETEITVGRARGNTITYDNRFVSSRHACLRYADGAWSIVDEQSSNGVFVNGQRVEAGFEHALSFGDVVTVLGLHIALGAGFFSCNDPDGAVSVEQKAFVLYEASPPDPIEDVRQPERVYFYPALRFARTVRKKSFSVDAPPQPDKPEEMSLAMRIGPSLVMALASVLSASTFVAMMAEQGSSMMRAIPMVAMAVAMLAGSVLWPILSQRNQRKQRVRKEAQRRASYSQYLSRVLSDIAQEQALQREILSENRITVQECLYRAHASDVRLMDRTPLHSDYLDVRLGLGEEPLLADIRFPDSHFSLDEDDLREAVDAQAHEPRVLHDVPVAYPLIEKHVLGVIGNLAQAHAFVRGMLVQVAALCSYEDVKLIMLCDRAQHDEWSFVSHLPHCFSDDRSMRYYACSLEEAGELGMFLERVIDERRRADRFDARDAKPYYVVVCASEQLADKADIVRAIVAERENRGVSLVAIAPTMQDLPKECRSVVELEGEAGYLLDRDDPAGNRKRFNPDIAVSGDSAEEFAFSLGKVRLDLATQNQRIPARLGFLEMQGAGNVEHLNVALRWHESNASASLACCVGVDAQGEPFLLNLHERFHGPHGLIAGTTGSGKSEFIITYILSMAVTYSPDDVAFVLIDYKGGGLAKAFDNEHVRLPHLAGVITNLDGAAITRSLVSIKSELKRRQELFNRARDVVGGDNVDIYDYLDLFRQGKMTEPCPHLFIVADEFAELKQQEPEFMDELISAARIGRSLGVHLILATQKPSGVVNDQIWSNSRFKVCLKVADEADSRELIKRPDAAELTQAGRFYLLVGYNEYFALGQSGYAGTRYMPRERFATTKDDSVVLVSNTGRPLVAVKPQQVVAGDEDRPESVAVLALVQEVARSAGLRARQLWLEPVPAMVTVDGLAAKYAFDLEETSDAFELNPLVGELDDPARQHQEALRLPLTREGSVLVYGTAESGVETVLYAALYALLRGCDASQLQVYALDFGSESLKAFVPAPQVGDVVCAGDDEKVRRFFDFIEAEANERRVLLSEHGGSYARYRAAGGMKPALVVILNDVAAFLEAYPKLEDRLARLTREAGRGGVYLIMTAASTSSVRVRMRQTFRQVLACNLADTSDYGMIFGSMRGLPQPNGFARGLAKTDEGVFEFQGAHLCESGDDFRFAAEFCVEQAVLSSERGIEPAPPVPTVPEQVTAEMLVAYDVPPACVPYGIYDDTLDVAYFDFREHCISRILFSKRRDGISTVRALIDFVSTACGWRTVVLDVGKLFAGRTSQCAFESQNDSGVLPTIKRLMLDVSQRGNCLEPDTLLLITGIAGYLGRASRDEGQVARDFLSNLDLGGPVRVLLVDYCDDATYLYEDWFRLHVGGKDGVWVGSGCDSQSVITVSYAPGVRIDPSVKGSCGYAVEDGIPRCVSFIELPNE